MEVVDSARISLQDQYVTEKSTSIFNHWISCNNIVNLVASSVLTDRPLFLWANTQSIPFYIPFYH